MARRLYSDLSSIRIRMCIITMIITMNIIIIIVHNNNNNDNTDNNNNNNSVIVHSRMTARLLVKACCNTP